MTQENVNPMINVQGSDFDSSWNKIFPYTFHKLPISARIDTADSEPIYTPVKNNAVVFRSDGLELNTVGTGFEIVQPDEVREVFRPLIDSGRVKLDRGSGFRHGSAMIAFGTLDNALSDIVPNDMVKAEVVMYSGFDGSMPIGGSFSVRQARCTNILPLEQRQAMNALLNQVIGYSAGNSGRKHSEICFRFKHTKNVRLKLENVHQQLDAAIDAFNATCEAFKAMAQKQVTRTKLETYVRNVFETADPIAQGEERSARFNNRTDRVIELLDTQRGLELVPASRGTMWQGYSAVTEYLTHEAGRNDDSRLNSMLFGENGRVSRLAMKLALQH